jgi:hypothetical protein
MNEPPSIRVRGAGCSGGNRGDTQTGSAGLASVGFPLRQDRRTNRLGGHLVERWTERLLFWIRICRRRRLKLRRSVWRRV